MLLLGLSLHQFQSVSGALTKCLRLIPHSFMKGNPESGWWHGVVLVGVGAWGLCCHLGSRLLSSHLSFLYYRLGSDITSASPKIKFCRDDPR